MQLVPGLENEDVDRRVRGILRQLRSYPLGVPPFLVTEMLARNQACVGLLSERLLRLEAALGRVEARAAALGEALEAEAGNAKAAEDRLDARLALLEARPRPPPPPAPAPAPRADRPKTSVLKPSASATSRSGRTRRPPRRFN